MPTLTNRHNIEDAIALAVAHDPYSHDGEISVTALLRPPQIAALEHQHADELSEDVSERLWALLGQAVHVVLDRAAPTNTLTEERLGTEVLGWTVTGRPDLWREDALGGELVDYKVTSVWSFLLGDKPEWSQQLNLYAALYRRHGFAVTKLTIAAILRDHIKGKALSDPEYPKIPFLSQDIAVWPEDEAERFLAERVALHQAARAGEYPPCTDAERWAKPEKWAVMKEGRKSAIRVLDSPEAAERVLGSEQRTGRGSYHIEHRPGTNTRCEGYCSVVRWCNQARALGVEAANG